MPTHSAVLLHFRERTVDFAYRLVLLWFLETEDILWSKLIFLWLLRVEIKKYPVVLR